MIPNNQKEDKGLSKDKLYDNNGIGGHTMNELLQQEEIYNQIPFTHQRALEFGLEINQYILNRNMKHVGVRITYKGILIYQYLMENKKEDTWLKRKEKTVLESGHSSLYVFYHQEDYSHMLNHDDYAVCGGGFPILENGQCVGAICVSGLPHEDDHGLIIQTLEKRRG